MMQELRIGFDGKLPSRGDFVGRGLPRSFLKPWQAWVDECLSASKEALGGTWLAAWLEAPIWRFALPCGVCGPDAVLGAILPSIDLAGRHYPLTVAALFDTVDAVVDVQWLVQVEHLACRALAEDLTPEQVLETLLRLPPPSPPSHAARQGWWTEGSPRVKPAWIDLPGLPAPASFATMIDDGAHRQEVPPLPALPHVEQ